MNNKQILKTILLLSFLQGVFFNFNLAQAQVKAVGRIISVDLEKQLVYLDVGQEDGIEAGNSFISYRKDNPYVAYIKINEVLEAHISTGVLRGKSPFVLQEGDVIISAEKAEDCLICHYSGEKRYQKELLHSSVLTINCSSCHEAHQPPAKEGTPITTQVDCLRCHNISLRGTRTHQPLFQKGCLGCHLLHPPLDKPVSKVETPDFCEGCHPQKKESVLKAHYNLLPSSGKCSICHDPHNKQKGKYLYLEKHSPFEDGSCDSCHTEENTGEGGEVILEKDVSKLCYECHDKFEAGSGKIHLPILCGDCLACHSPHLSSRKYFLKAEGFKLCSNCHASVLEKSVKHRPAVEGKCLFCHKSHQAKELNLLSEPLTQLCEKCHKLAKTVSRFPHPPFDKKNCNACHLPHSSSLKYLFRDKPTQICLNCHDKLEDKAKPRHQKMFDKPVPKGFPRNGYHLEITSENLITCYTCHESHGGAYENLLRESPEFLCGLCHSEHWLKSFTPKQQ